MANSFGFSLVADIALGTLEARDGFMLVEDMLQSISTRRGRSRA
jgi:hypothetical protein